MFTGVVNDLVTHGALKTHPKPKGVEHPEWPHWAKPQHRSGRARNLGCVEFIGDEPYTEPTPRQVENYRDISLDQEVIRLRSASVREAIDYYVPPLAFEAWLNFFVGSLDRPSHYDTLYNTLDHIPEQMNMRPPSRIAPAAVVRKYLDRGPDLARYVLSFSEHFRQAPNHPDILLTIAIYQAAHHCFLERVQGALHNSHRTRAISTEQWQNALHVFEHPLKQFDDFLIFATLLPLILLRRNEIIDSADPRATDATWAARTAITEGSALFLEKRLLRRNLSNGDRMICPANRHLRWSIQRRQFERLHTFVIANQSTAPVAALLGRTKKMALSGAFFRTANYWHFLGLGLEKNQNARGGKGLIQ